MPNTNPLSAVTNLLGNSGGLSSGAGQSSALTQQLTSLTQQMQQLQTVNQTQIDSIEANTQAVAQNSSAKGGGGSTASVDREHDRERAGVRAGVESADFGTGEFVWRGREQRAGSAGSVCCSVAGECDGGDQRVDGGGVRSGYGGWGAASAGSGVDGGDLIIVGGDYPDYGARCRRWIASHFSITATILRRRCGRRCLQSTTLNDVIRAV